jgi:hypothetical protein
MPLLIHALLLAVLLPAMGGTPAEPGPKCHAELKGTRLVTSIEFLDGYRLEAPWDVLSSQYLDASGKRGAVVAELQLEQLLESDAITGRRIATTLAAPVRLRLQASTDAHLVYQAAETWCSTVLQARRGGTALEAPSPVKPGRVT